jgi:hypothetical protein
MWSVSFGWLSCPWVAQPMSCMHGLAVLVFKVIEAIEATHHTVIVLGDMMNAQVGPRLGRHRALGGHTGHALLYSVGLFTSIAPATCGGLAQTTLIMPSSQ